MQNLTFCEHAHTLGNELWQEIRFMSNSTMWQLLKKSALCLRVWFVDISLRLIGEFWWFTTDLMPINL